MKENFCPNCGRETEKLVEGVCRECFRERNIPCKIPKEVELNLCKSCGRSMIGEEWVDIDFEAAVKERIRREVNAKEGVKNFELVVKPSREKGKWEAIGKGEKEGVKLKQRKTVKVKLDETTCDRCSKISSGYFEAVVQIRGSDEKVENVLEVAKEALENSRNKKAFVSDVEKVENGVNLSIGSKSVARRIAKKISSRYKTERKDTKTLYGEEEGQRKYRSTYLVRILE